MLNGQHVVRGSMAICIALLIMSVPVYAQSADNFYAGKRVIINVGSAPGGGYDAQARLMSRHLEKYIPGHPSVIVQNKPGAGGLIAANQFYNVAPKDGTEIALLQRTAIVAKSLIGKDVFFDVAKFNWLGSLASEPGVLIVWHTSPVKTAQDLLTTPLIVGGAGSASDSELTPRVLNAIIGTKLKLVSGYQSDTAVMLAMERGEVEGLTNWSWSNAKRNPRYLGKKAARVVMQFGLHPLDELKGVPTPFDFAKAEADKTLLSLYFAPKAVSRPVTLPPGVPEARVKVMRKAFLDMTKDPEFLAEAEKLGIPLDPTYDSSVHEVIDVVQKAPADVVLRLRVILGLQK